MVSRQPSLIARILEPLPAFLWTLFIVWTVLVAMVWMSEFGNVELDQRVTNPGLRSALEFILRSLDAAWFALAGANVYFALVEAESLAVARRWALFVMGGSWIISASSAWTSFPLGAIHYTARLGMRIGPVPFGLLLMWFAFVVGARALVLRVAPRATHLQVSMAAGVLVALTAANLDPLAWRFRAFWLWQPPSGMPAALAPLQNITTWLLASFGFAFGMRETRVASAGFGGFPRPAMIAMWPDVRGKLLSMGLEPVNSAPEPFSAYVREEAQKWGKVIRQANVRAE